MNIIIIVIVKIKIIITSIKTILVVFSFIITMVNNIILNSNLSIIGLPVRISSQKSVLEIHSDFGLEIQTYFILQFISFRILLQLRVGVTSYNHMQSIPSLTGCACK